MLHCFLTCTLTLITSFPRKAQTTYLSTVIFFSVPYGITKSKILMLLGIYYVLFIGTNILYKYTLRYYDTLIIINFNNR